MKILSVEAENFRAYTSLSWKLPATGLTLIDAVTDTGRSNMAGKTTTCDSIFWCLYGYLPKWGGPKGGPVDGVIKRGATSCRVVATLQHNGSQVRIERSRPNKLKVFVDGIEIHGKTADLDDRIEQLVGHSAEQFLLGIYISQDRKSAFYTMSDTERTALLSVVAGLEELDKGLVNAKSKRDTVQSSLERLEGALTILRGQLNDLPERLISLELDLKSKTELQNASQHDFAMASKAAAQIESQLTDQLRATILELQSERDGKSSEIHSERQERADRLGRLGDSIREATGISPAFIQAVNEAKDKLQEIQAQNKAEEKLSQRNEKRREEISKAINNAEKAQEGRCQACKQDLPVWDREVHAQKFLEEAQAKSTQIEVESDLIDELAYSQAVDKAQAELARHRAEVEARPNQIKSEMASLRSNIDSIDAQLNSINLQFNLDKNRAESETSKYKAEAQQLLMSARAELNLRDSELKNSVSAIDSLKKSVAELESKLEENKVIVFTLTKDLNEQLDLIELFGPKGFRSVCFDGLIERIGQRAGQLFSLMTDGIYSTRLDQVGEDSKGSQKLILKPIIIKGGQEVISDDLSGGARRMAMIAYDVAVSEAIDSEAPLLLDEALDGLDSVGKAEAMRLLEEIGRTRPVYVIDHSSEFKSSFGQVLTVTHKNGNSELQEI